MSYANYHSRRVPSFISYMANLLRYRHLCWNLVGSDLRSRFRRSYLGILWAIIQPLGYSLIIAWAWGTIFGAANYWSFAVYVYSGMLVWEYFQNCVNGSLDGLMNAVGYLRQARIPLFVFQLRVPLTGLVTLFFGLIGLFLMMGALSLFGLFSFPAPGLHLLLLPAFFGVLVLFMTPVAMIFSVLGAQLRDLKHIMSLVLQVLFFLSPVMMTRNMLDTPQLEILKTINPMVPILDMLRDPLLHGQYWSQQAGLTVSLWGAGLWIAAAIVAGRAGRKVVFAI
jgi:lipopolysaccharide transport system permease protein